MIAGDAACLIGGSAEEEAGASDEMAWTAPRFPRNEVNAAGASLTKDDVSVSYDEWEHAMAVIGNWRSSHSFPLNTFTVGLKRKAAQIDPNSLIAQRIKRLSSIAHKLERFRTMQLSQMQDIGGCRAIVGTVRGVNELVEQHKNSAIKHKLTKENDYIKSPKASGYRGVHLIYRYYSDRTNIYNGLQIEMQFRSQFQHAWATAVETVGTFVHQALKSSIGATDWLRFFSLMGTAIAFLEDAPSVPGTPMEQQELILELRKYHDQLAFTDRLKTIGAALDTLEQPSTKDASYFLLKLDPAAHQVTVAGFKKGELEEASRQYLAVEQDIRRKEGQDAVLVSVDSLTSLRRAYPNYFLDTAMFIDLVNETIG